MKLLFVSDFSFNGNSGSAGSLIAIGHQLESQGHVVDYIWKQEKRIIKSHNLSRFFELPIIQYLKLKSVLSHACYDVVIISQPHAWLAIKRLKRKYPAILFVNRTHGWELRIAPLLWNLERSVNVIRKVKNKLTFFLLKHCSFLTVKYSSAVICACSADANFIKKSYPAYSNKVFNISYGLDQDFINLNVTKPPNHNIKFLFTGQYIERKGIQDLIYVFKNITLCGVQFELTFIVNEESIAKVRDDFYFIRNDTLHVLPWMDRKRLMDIYREHDAFLMPSYGEGFGKTTLEAMACGLCVIGYDDGAVTDFCKHQVNALVSETGDKEGLLKNIQFALYNQTAIKEFGLQAYKVVQTQTWRKNSFETLNLLYHQARFCFK